MSSSGIEPAQAPCRTVNRGHRGGNNKRIAKEFVLIFRLSITNNQIHIFTFHAEP